MLTKVEKGDIINLPNKLNIYRQDGCVFVYRIGIPFFVHTTIVLSLIKCSSAAMIVCFLPISVYSLFGDDWSLRFCALILVGALFCFLGEI